MILTLTLALVIGLSLGLLGSGGSILTLPAMVYGAGVPEHEAVPMSLAVVGVTAAAGVALQAGKGWIDWRSAGLFAAGGAVGVIPGGFLSRFVPGPLLMLVFAAIMMVVAIRMLRGTSAVVSERGRARLGPALGAGAGVGALTSFLGAGGGFLVVPALERFLGVPLPKAMATSLVVITINCAAGLAVHVGQASLDWSLMIWFASFSLVGMAAGVFLVRRVASRGLRVGFGLFVLVMALFVLFQNRLYLFPGLAAAAGSGL